MQKINLSWGPAIVHLRSTGVPSMVLNQKCQNKVRSYLPATVCWTACTQLRSSMCCRRMRDCNYGWREITDIFRHVSWYLLIFTSLCLPGLTQQMVCRMERNRSVLMLNKCPLESITSLLNPATEAMATRMCFSLSRVYWGCNTIKWDREHWPPGLFAKHRWNKHEMKFSNLLSETEPMSAVVGWQHPSKRPSGHALADLNKKLGSWNRHLTCFSSMMFHAGDFNL